MSPSRSSVVTVVALALAVPTLAGCDAGAVPATPPISPGSSAAPREVNIIARDWSFQPSNVDLVPGETVLFHVVNGGLDVQDAWEAAEAATVGHPPGPTPVVSVPPELAGVRVVVPSGQRVDVTWTVPIDVAASDPAGQLMVGCHIPGHWEKGMVVPIRLVDPGTGP